jgi:hypothetical protein
MTNPAFQDSEVLKFILEPLLEDFDYWFGRSLLLLEQEEINFLTEPQKNDLITRVQAMMPWHNLLMECQAVGMRFRQSQAT